MIDVLTKGDLFGEIGVLTNLKRTASIISEDTCMFNSLSKKNLEKIMQAYPSTLDFVKENISEYNDENFLLRYIFVQNIPYFRTASINLIRRIVFLLRPYVYNKGDYILEAQTRYSDRINVILKGSVQVRVMCLDIDK